MHISGFTSAWLRMYYTRQRGFGHWWSSFKKQKTASSETACHESDLGFVFVVGPMRSPIATSLGCYDTYLRTCTTDKLQPS